jgi:hypothetical protein
MYRQFQRIHQIVHNNLHVIRDEVSLLTLKEVTTLGTDGLSSIPEYDETPIDAAFVEMAKKLSLRPDGDVVAGTAEFRVSKDEMDRIEKTIDIQTTKVKFNGKRYKITNCIQSEQTSFVGIYTVELEVQA